MRALILLAAASFLAAPTLTAGVSAPPVPLQDGLEAESPAIAAPSVAPRIVTNADLPEPVARTRKLLMDIARSGDVEGLAAVIEENGRTPVFSFGGDETPSPSGARPPATGRGGKFWRSFWSSSRRRRP